MHSVSNHSSMVVNIGANIFGGPKPFKFFTHWGKLEKFLPTVQRAQDTPISGSKMYAVVHKLKEVKKPLKGDNA